MYVLVVKTISKTNLEEVHVHVCIHFEELQVYTCM